MSSRLKSSDLAGSTITLKLKTADFRQRTRSQSIHAPTQLAAKIFAISREMLAKEIDGTAFRLMGTGVSALRPGSLADDTDMLDRRSAHAERAMDDLRKKFGNAAVIRGIAYTGRRRRGFETIFHSLRIRCVPASTHRGQRPAMGYFVGIKIFGLRRARINHCVPT